VIIGGGFRVPQDVCPYALAGGYPLRISGLNLIGLRRRNFPKKTIAVLRQVYKILFHSNLNTSQAVERIKGELDMIPEVRTILDFIERSDRGLVK
jgi:UDP-N-acetylglucosamine acyltransferase